MARKIIRRNRGSDSGAHWISYSDMLSSLLLVFMLAVTFSIYQYYSLLETKTRELKLKEDEILLTQGKLKLQQGELDKAKAVLLGKEKELEGVQITLDKQKLELDEARATLKSKEEELAKLQVILGQQSAALQDQQSKIDELLGIRTAIIKELSQTLQANNIKSNIDPKTGDIVLSSSLLFDSAKDKLLPTGEAELAKLIPAYLDVVLNPKYSNFVAEIIIEGHTDSKGSYMFNLELSQNRALNVAKFCLELEGLSKERKLVLQSILTAKGRSFSDRVFDKDGNEDYQASRRVEIKFRLKDTEMIQKMSEILK